MHGATDGLDAEAERDIYLQCMELANASDPGPLVQRTLALLTTSVGARSGYIELTDDASTETRRWHASSGIDEEETDAIRDRISRGVIAAALETGETINSPSAMLDPRFQSRDSVQRDELQAVLCVPLHASGIQGVVYLQDRVGEGKGAGVFTDNQERCVERVARFVSTLAGRMLEVLRTREQVDATANVRARFKASEIVGKSAALADVLEQLAFISDKETDVFLTGPVGTGKSMFARTLHDNSHRASGPFIAINCAALPEALVESELFGAERGAHSGVAHGRLQGKVEAAEGGTLFLDEVAELPVAVQAKLLSFVQSKEFLRLGGTQINRADVRLIFATHRNLEHEIRADTFREDLYYRLRTAIAVRVPALSERRDDIPLLARHFCSETCRASDLPGVTLSPSALAAILHEEWPGNVRELEAKCRHAVMAAQRQGHLTIEAHHFAEEVAQGHEPKTFHAARAEWERSFLAGAISERDWNVAQTARELDMSRSHLNELIRRYGLNRTT